MSRLALLAALCVTAVYRRPVGMLLIYLRDRHDFPRQVAAVYAALEAEA